MARHKRTDASDDGAQDALKLASLRDLTSFVKAVEAESFSAAAHELGVSQPTISIHIKTLEKFFGTKLLVRGRGVKLTSAGQDLYHRCRHIVAKSVELSTVADNLRSMRQGTLRLGFAMPRYAMPLLAEFLRANPGLRVVLRPGNAAELLEALSKSEIDVAITTAIEAPTSLEAKLIATQRPILAVPAAHAFAGHKVISLQALESERLIVREPGSMTRVLFEQACRRYEVHLAHTLEVPSREGLLEAVASGLGVGVILNGETNSYRGVQAVEFSEEVPSGGVFVLSQTDGDDLPMVEKFLQTVATSQRRRKR